MRVDALALELRPRPAYEAADLGVRLVQSCWPSLLRCHLPVMALLALLLTLLQTQAGVNLWLPVIFLAKPFIDRAILFVLARAAFGQASGWSDAWRARRALWFGQPFNTFFVARLSPWRALTQPVLQLEGASRAERRLRLQQIRGGRRGTALLLGGAFAHVEIFLVLGLASLLLWFAPPEQRGGALELLTAGVWPVWLGPVYAGVVSFVEPFYVAAGFGVYLNRRVELEAWDIEQELRRVFA